MLATILSVESVGRKIVLVLSTGLLFLAAQCAYNLYFHKLRKFPGPKIAAIGPYYEFYHDVCLHGNYAWKVDEMHRKYGPIVRINSRSLDIQDPDFYSKIYASAPRRTDKEPAAVAGYGHPRATIATLDHDLHRQRRAALSPFFSKRAAANLEPVIHERLDALCSRLVATISKPQSVDLVHAFSALTADIVTTHVYGSHSSCLAKDNFDFGLKRALDSLLEVFHLIYFLPFLPSMLKRLPPPIIRMLSPDFPLVEAAREENRQRVLNTLEDEKDNITKKAVVTSALAHRTDATEDEGNALERLLDDGETIILAGIDTTARTLTTAFYNILNRKTLLEKLRQELHSQLPDEAWTVSELERLPYLRGIVQESLRLMKGHLSRLPRISPDEPLQYNDFVIPPGTPVSQSSYHINHDASVFPDPSSFSPDRWVQAAAEGVNLDKYMVSFSKGTRGCLGINVAYATLYLSIARIATLFDMDLDMTPEEHSSFVSPKEPAMVVKAKVTKKF